MDVQVSTSFEQWLQTVNISYKKDNSCVVDEETTTTLYNIEETINISLLEFKRSKKSEIQDIINSDAKTIKLWQDQWIHQREIVCGRILSLLQRGTCIYGRKTIVQKITQTEADDFLNGNHLQGSTKAKIKYGVYYNGLLVSAATFTWPRKFYKEDHVHLSFGLIRHCNLIGHNVVGGLSKIISQLKKDYQPDDIMTFVDLDWSEGRSYQQLGFELVEKTEPETFYIDRTDFKRYYPQEIVKLSKDPDQFIRIQNRGNNKFKLFIPQNHLKQQK